MSLPFEIEMKRDEIRAEIERLGAELVDIGFRHTGHRSVITLVVDKDGGITLDECAAINRRIGEWLDDLSAQYGEGQDFIRGSYFLEVNSPGLDRPLKTERDFKRAAGATVRIVFRDEAGKTFVEEGEVSEISDGRVLIRRSKGETIAVDLANVVRATRQIKFGKQGQ